MLLAEDQTCLAVTVSELLADHFKLGKRNNYCMIIFSWKSYFHRRVLALRALLLELVLMLVNGQA